MGAGGLWLLLKSPKGFALPCDGEMVLEASAQLCCCQLKMRREKVPPSVLIAEREGKGNECSPWAFSEGIRETTGAEKPGEEVIHMFNSPFGCYYHSLNAAMSHK